ncbi:MAG TPA: amino acid ABC transporter permease [Stellaceae bacterium]|nr:amino acid ABC transporter permease [Stellaceae bacterium]
MRQAGPYSGRVGALRRFLGSCVATPLNLALTVLVLLLIVAIVPALVEWAVVDAAWRGTSSADCPNRDAACWVFVRLRFGQILYGGYPAAERWRVDLAAALALAGLVLMAAPRLPRTLIAALLFVAGPVIAAILLAGGIFGLARVPSRDWGGLTLTLVVALGTIAFAIPLGLGLAIARRSALPVIRWLAVAFIELWRGVPLIPVLFMAVIMFPLFMPAGVEVDTLIRVLVAFILFNAASMAEVFRGGFQAIPQSQYEAAASLGLGPWRTLGLVVLPQVVKVAIPGLVNTCVSVTKETTVILILGLADLLAVIQAGAADPAWLVGDQIRSTGYFFAGLVFWSVCFSMSRAARRLERRRRRDDAAPLIASR